ncbi:MAG TPA: phosphatidate cytidylyltransferase [Solirubrobacteraceae bacterium]|nr:phosphatidate cytidylyltransferase [Solirubrobacteraceae bacterium]
MAAARRPPRRGSGEGRERKRGRGSELLARVAIGVPLAILAIGFDGVGGTTWAVVMLLLGLACLNELYRLLERWKPVPAVGYVAVVAMCLAARFGNQRDVLAVAVAGVPVLFLAVAGRRQRAGATISIAGTLLGIYWIGFAFAHAVLLRQLAHGGGVMIDVMLGTFLGDTGAYLGGRLFGRRPLAPAISPNKTVEGLFCGMLVAILAVYIAGLYQPWLSHADALWLGLAVAVLGPLGDLFESLVKRDAAAKDAGHLFGVHGGALDRLDAVSFTVVAAYYIWVALPHG